MGHGWVQIEVSRSVQVRYVLYVGLYVYAYDGFEGE